uniref:Ig-like domain-containing protein n=1 Tax=Oryzias latipes TaxID=8090 RepID=A0A3B3I0U7_ORYLA
MDPLHIILPLLWAVSCSFDWTSASVSEVTVRHGDNITLYCDCKMTGVEPPAWFRNCSHENQPVFVLDKKYFFANLGKTRFIWTNNDSSKSYDLTIINVTYSDEGFYYCGTEGNKVEDKEKIDIKIWRLGGAQHPGARTRTHPPGTRTPPRAPPGPGNRHPGDTAAVAKDPVPPNREGVGDRLS